MVAAALELGNGILDASFGTALIFNFDLVDSKSRSSATRREFAVQPVNSNKNNKNSFPCRLAMAARD